MSAARRNSQKKTTKALTDPDRRESLGPQNNLRFVDKELRPGLLPFSPGREFGPDRDVPGLRPRLLLIDADSHWCTQSGRLVKNPSVTPTRYARKSPKPTLRRPDDTTKYRLTRVNLRAR